MKSVQRTRGIRRAFRVLLSGRRAPRYFTAGDRACGKMMWEARLRRRAPGPSDSQILLMARFDLSRELREGYWRARAV